MLQPLRHFLQILRWHLRGKPVPAPHIIKQHIVKDYQSQFSPRIFIESGTYLGDMVAFMEGRVSEVYSIELSEELCKQAQTRFASLGHVHIMQGDTIEVLPHILKQISESCLFWLDGHFSGGITARGEFDFPILQELDHIGRHKIKNHVILIDDARFFSGSGAPAAKTEIIEKLRAINPAYNVSEKDDIIRAFVP